MYLSHFGLSEWPFSNTPDPRFVYLGPYHEEALAHLLYGVRQSGGFVQLTGEVGTGKTTICRYLLDKLPGDVDVALILNPMLTPEQLLATLCDELGVAYPPGASSRKVFVDALYQHLLATHSRGRRTVLIVDEAQNLSVEALEQLRLLTNLETTKHKLLQIILIGQPELIDMLRRRELRQLAQRITARYHLLPFGDRETFAYVRHRLSVAGRAGWLFEPAARRAVHRASRGVPRLINVICDRALLGAYGERRPRVDAKTVRRAAREIFDGGTLEARRRRRWPWAAAAVFILLAVGVAGASFRGATGLLSAPDILGRAAGHGESAKPPSVPEATAPPSGTPAPSVGPALASRLTAVDPPTERASAFASLFARWRQNVAKDADPCEAAARAGLQCLAAKGTWATVRRLDLPVVVKLVTPEGGQHWAAVVALDSEEAVVELGVVVFAARLSELDQLWDGSFELLWQPPPIGTPFVGPGMQGRAVQWLRQRLDALEGRTAGVDTLEYDEALRNRVLAFQRSQSLDSDGIAGVETLARLSAVLDRRVPLLSSDRSGS